MPKTRQERRTSFKFPALHQEVAEAVSDAAISPWFNDKEDEEKKNPTKSKTTFVMARFLCTNKNCDKGGWGSKKVATVIEGYDNHGYSAIVYNQRCDSCDQLGRMKLDEKSYVDRVAWRLKVWAGVPMGEPVFGDKKGPPHLSEFCEGCKAGHCLMSLNMKSLRI